LYATRLPRSFSDLNFSINSIGAVPAENGASALALSGNLAASLQRYYSNVSVYSKDNFVDAESLPPMLQHDAVYLGSTVRMNSTYPYETDVLSPFATPQNSLVFQKWMTGLSPALLVLHSKQSIDALNGEAISFYDGLLNKTKMIVSPQWTPDELAGSVLLKRFFYNLSTGQPPAEALRLAQKTVHDQIDTHASAWAAYRLFGDFNP
jgi:hypothetical protein